MRITLATDVTDRPDLNKQLHYALQELGSLPFELGIWMRDKDLSPDQAALWCDRWRWLCERHGLRFELSMAHAGLLQPGDVLHVPDQPKMRHQAHQHLRDHPRILSLHGLDQLEIALANQEVELLLSPLYPPKSKPQQGPLLDRAGLQVLAKEQRARIHLMGGLSAKRIAPLIAGKFAGFTVMGAWLKSPLRFLQSVGDVGQSSP